MDTNSKNLLSPSFAELSGNRSSSSRRQSSVAIPVLTKPQTHSKLRPCRSLDARGVQLESALDEIGNRGSSTVDAGADYCNGAGHWQAGASEQSFIDERINEQITVDRHVQRPHSARNRPQSACKSGRRGRQPNFTFTDMNSEGPNAPTGSCSDGRMPSDDVKREIADKSMRLKESGGDDDVRLNSGRTRNVNRSVENRRNGVVVSPLPGYDQRTPASGYNSQRRHSLHSKISIVLNAPTPASGLQFTEESIRSSRSSNCSNEDVADGVDDDGSNNYHRRRRSLTEDQPSAARKRALARLASNETGSNGATSYRDNAGDNEARIAAEVEIQRRRLTAVTACRGQLPRKLDPLFHS